MVILLVGASGLLGGALRDALSHRQVRQLVRRPPRPDDTVETAQWSPPAPPPLSVFDDVSAVINLGGAGVGDERWTRRRLQVIDPLLPHRDDARLRPRTRADPPADPVLAGQRRGLLRRYR